jgi:GNAT superfamily N-acetyltransferase
MSKIAFRPALVDEAPAISALVPEVFEAFVAPHYGAQGHATFGHEAAPEAMAARPADGRTALVACAAESCGLVGYIEIEKSHIRGIFVAGPYQRRGIARALLARAFDDNEEAEITVNAAPGSLDAYAGLGFGPAGPRATINGLTFLPMVRRSAHAPAR